jgi:hypothetical protein
MLRFVRLFSIPALTLVAALSFSTPALADDCQTMFDAATKLLTVPVHSYTTETASGKPRTSEAIYINGAIYINVKGKWIRSKATTQDMLKQEQENIRNAKTTCRHVRDESVNGEAAALYVAHSENEEVKSDAQTWISKSKGLPLRTEEDIDTGGGDKRHMSIRYEYGNIQPPAVMQ